MTIFDRTESNSYTKRFTVVSWNEKPAQVDLVFWQGKYYPFKVITLTRKEALELAKAIQEHINQGEQ